MIDTTAPEFAELRRRLDAVARRFPDLKSYRLDENHNIVECSFLDAVVGAVNDQTNVVEQTDITDDIRVSTVFLGPLMLLMKSQEAPRLFETMIFGGEYDGRQFRSATWDEAKHMHAVALAMVGGGGTPPATSGREPD